MITPWLTMSAGAYWLAATVGPAAASTEIARILSSLRIIAPSAGQVPRAMQTRGGQSRSPSSPIPASRTLKPIEVAAGRFVVDV